MDLRGELIQHSQFAWSQMRAEAVPVVAISRGTVSYHRSLGEHSSMKDALAPLTNTVFFQRAHIYWINRPGRPRGATPG
jgi:hypothetical protein